MENWLLNNPSKLEDISICLKTILGVNKVLQNLCKHGLNHHQISYPSPRLATILLDTSCLNNQPIPYPSNCMNCRTLDALIVLFLTLLPLAYTVPPLHPLFMYQSISCILYLYKTTTNLQFLSVTAVEYVNPDNTCFHTCYNFL